MCFAFLFGAQTVATLPSNEQTHPPVWQLWWTVKRSEWLLSHWLLFRVQHCSQILICQFFILIIRTESDFCYPHAFHSFPVKPLQKCSLPSFICTVVTGSMTTSQFAGIFIPRNTEPLGPGGGKSSSQSKRLTKRAGLVLTLKIYLSWIKKKKKIPVGELLALSHIFSLWKWFDYT